MVCECECEYEGRPGQADTVLWCLSVSMGEDGLTLTQYCGCESEFEGRRGQADTVLWRGVAAGTSISR